MLIGHEDPLYQLIRAAIQGECPEVTDEQVLLDVATLAWYPKLAIDAFVMGAAGWKEAQWDANRMEAEVERLNEANMKLQRENAALQEVVKDLRPFGTCVTCAGVIARIPFSPEGGLWAHVFHPEDEHAAVLA